MPKSYSENEKEIIKNNLRKEALDCLLTYGVRKTTVDELVKRVNIPKGTFYLFYKSKELLLYDAINEVHNKIQSEMIDTLSRLSDDVSVDELTDCIFKCYKVADTANIIKILSNGELELLLRKLPDDIIAEHLSHDDNSIEQLISSIPAAKEKPINVFSSAFRAVFLASLYKKEVGEESFDDVMYMLFKGLVEQLLK